VRRWALLVVALIVIGGAAITFAVTRGSGQPEVDADVLPVLATGKKADVYVDCSKIDAVAYFEDNPCQTFVLLQSSHFRSATEFWSAETRQMKRSGWHNSAPQVADFDGGGGLVSLSESWVSRDHRACAYVTTDRRGTAAEAKTLFPYDPYNQPQGVLDFYRAARAANPNQALWVRLRPPNRDGRCIG
jgi:hypothetical protein